MIGRWYQATVADRADPPTGTACRARAWRLSSQQTAAGQRYDFRAVCTLEPAARIVGQQNFLLTIQEPTGSVEYRIIDAIRHEHLGYLELGLVRADNQG